MKFDAVMVAPVLGIQSARVQAQGTGVLHMDLEPVT